MTLGWVLLGQWFLGLVLMWVAYTFFSDEQDRAEFEEMWESCMKKAGKLASVTSPYLAALVLSVSMAALTFIWLPLLIKVTYDFYTKGEDINENEY